MSMKHFFSTSFILLGLVISAAGVVPTAYADTNVAAGAACGEMDTCVDGYYCSFYTNTCVPNSQMATEQAKAQTATTAATPITPDNPVKNDAAYASIIQWIMKLFAWLVGVAAITLDNAVYYTVVTMGDYVKNLAAVGVTWRILRDIGNILLIFGFLAVGITTILNVDWYGGGKKMLPMMLVAAVFLNFSLFISEAIIDTGNLFATQFYTQINGGNPAGAKNFDLTSVQNDGISNKIMSQLGLQSIYGDALRNQEVFKAGNSWIIGFMGIILFIVTAFVMFSLAFVLIARFVALVFLIIVAPIGFAGLAVPGFAARAKQYWTTLFEQTITAPILLLMLYIALAVITDAKFMTGFGSSLNSGGWTGYVRSATGTANLTGFAGLLLSFLVAMGLLLAVTVYAKRWSAFGGDWATRMGGRLSFGAASLGMRATLGSAGNLLASKRMQSAARAGGFGGLLLKGAVLGGKGLRSATYDVRNTGALKNIPMVSGNVDFGTGATITAKQAHDAQYGVKPIREWLQHSAEEREQAGREIDFKNAQADLAAGRITQDQFDTITTPIISKMTTKQLEELSGIRKGTEALVRNLSPEQFESLMKSDKFNEVEKEKMRTGRYSSLHTAIIAGDKGAVRQWSAKDLATALPDILKNPADAATLVGLMSEGQFDAVVKNDKLTKGQQQQLRDFSGPGKILSYLDIVRGRPLSAPALQAAGIIPAGMTPAAATAAVTPLLATMGHKKFAKLRSEVLTDPLAISLLTPKHLAALMTDGDLDTAQIHTIATTIRAAANPTIMTYLDPITNPIAATYWV